MAARYIVTYDISDNKTRLRVGKITSGYIYRVQKSVFEGRSKSKHPFQDSEFSGTTTLHPYVLWTAARANFSRVLCQVAS